MELKKEYEEVLKMIEEVREGLNIHMEGSTPISEMTLEQMEAFLEKTQGMLDKLNEKANAIASNMGMSREQLEKFLQNPHSLNPEDRYIVDQLQSHLSNFQQTLSEMIVRQTNDVQVRKGLQERPPRPGAKRNWVQM